MFYCPKFGALGWLTVDIEKIFGRAIPYQQVNGFTYSTKKMAEILIFWYLTKMVQDCILYSNEENREQLNKMGDKQAGTGVFQVGESSEEKV